MLARIARVKVHGLASEHQQNLNGASMHQGLVRDVVQAGAGARVPRRTAAGTKAGRA